MGIAIISVITGAIVALGGILTPVLLNTRERDEKQREWLRTQRISAYTQFATEFQRIAMGGAMLAYQEMESEHKIAQTCLLLGSATTRSAISDFMEMLLLQTVKPITAPNAGFTYANVMEAMRADLGAID